MKYVFVDQSWEDNLNWHTQDKKYKTKIDPFALYVFLKFESFPQAYLTFTYAKTVNCFRKYKLNKFKTTQKDNAIERILS